MSSGGAAEEAVLGERKGGEGAPCSGEGGQQKDDKDKSGLVNVSVPGVEVIRGGAGCNFDLLFLDRQLRPVSPTTRSSSVVEEEVGEEGGKGFEGDGKRPEEGPEAGGVGARCLGLQAGSVAFRGEREVDSKNVEGVAWHLSRSFVPARVV